MLQFISNVKNHVWCGSRKNRRNAVSQAVVPHETSDLNTKSRIQSLSKSFESISIPKFPRMWSKTQRGPGGGGVNQENVATDSRSWIYYAVYNPLEFLSSNLKTMNWKYTHTQYASSYRFFQSNFTQLECDKAKRRKPGGGEVKQKRNRSINNAMENSSNNIFRMRSCYSRIRARMRSSQTLQKVKYKRSDEKYVKCFETARVRPKFLSRHAMDEKKRSYTCRYLWFFKYGVL